MKNNRGYSLTELVIIAGLLGSMGAIVASIVNNSTAIIKRSRVEAQGKLNLLQAHSMLDKYLGQAINMAGVADFSNSALDATEPEQAFMGMRVGQNTFYYHTEGSRMLYEYDSNGQAHRTTSFNDISAAAASDNIDLLAMFFFEETPSGGDTTRNLSTTLGAAAMYFQRPTNYTSGSLLIVRTNPPPNGTTSYGNLELPPCRTACPANVTSVYVDGLTRVAINHLKYPEVSASRPSQIVPDADDKSWPLPANYTEIIPQSHDYSPSTTGILNPPNAMTPPTGVQLIIESRKFKNLDSSKWLFCALPHISNCAGISGFRDLTKIVEITFRNNIFYQGSPEDPSTMGSNEAHIEERTHGNIYYFGFSYSGRMNQ